MSFEIAFKIYSSGMDKSEVFAIKEELF